MSMVVVWPVHQRGGSRFLQLSSRLRTTVLASLWKAVRPPSRGRHGRRSWVSDELMQQSEEPIEQADYSVHNPEWVLMLRATSIIRRKHCIDGPFAWQRNAAYYDKQAERVYLALLEGKPLPRQYR